MKIDVYATWVFLQSIDVKKLQGTTMNVSTEHGPLKVKAIYAASSCVTSCTGKVEVGNVHGELQEQTSSLHRNKFVS